MNRVLLIFERLALAISVACVVSIMFIVSYDAVSRYAFRAPLPWAYELITYYLLIAATYFAVSPTFQQGDHINIDLFRTMMSPEWRARLDVLWCLLAAAIFAIITYGSATEMIHAWTRNEFLPGYFTWPAWASYLPIVLGFGLCVLRLLAHAAALAVHGRDPGVDEHELSAELGEHHE
jgi:TRAP-type C4-dicarboxylate transport system permease small subunit